MNQYNGAYYDFVIRHSIPKWVDVLGHICWPVFTLTLPFVLAVTEYKKILFIDPSSVEDIVSILFAISIVACIVHTVAYRHCSHSKKYTLSRNRAISWGGKKAERYLRNQAVTTELNSVPLSFDSHETTEDQIA